jgi:hypothetical protein
LLRERGKENNFHVQLHGHVNDFENMVYLNYSFPGAAAATRWLLDNFLVF